MKKAICMIMLTISIALVFFEVIPSVVSTPANYEATIKCTVKKSKDKYIYTYTVTNKKGGDDKYLITEIKIYYDTSCSVEKEYIPSTWQFEVVENEEYFHFFVKWASSGIEVGKSKTFKIKSGCGYGTFDWEANWQEWETITYSDGALAPKKGSNMTTEGVGGYVIPVDKFALLAPYIGLTSTILISAVITAVYFKRVKRRKEKQC